MLNKYVQVKWFVNKFNKQRQGFTHQSWSNTPTGEESPDRTKAVKIGRTVSAQNQMKDQQLWELIGPGTVQGLSGA